MLYRSLFSALLRWLDPELAHHLGMLVLRVASALGLTRLLRLRDTNPIAVQAMGLDFDGPFGLAAGFDKNAIAVRALGDIGFSHVEIGTVTALAQPGNPKPRLFRLIADRALVNRMGFNNDGAERIAARLVRLRNGRGAERLPIIGVNIGKSRATELEDAVSDYQLSARLLAPHADYLVVNVSSPNTPGLRSLQSIEALRPILLGVRSEIGDVPLLVKIAPDLSDPDITELARLALELKLDGIIASNTTIGRDGLLTDARTVAECGAGGLSGPILRDRALGVLRLLRATLPSDFTVISVGGIETAADVEERLREGATLTQGYTGFVYQGPLWARRINKQLLARKKSGRT